MDTKSIPEKKASHWLPITDQHNLAVLGKLGEEACELGAALFRCIIQGIDEREPETHKVNRDWVEEEIADVLALASIAVRRLGLDMKEIEARRDRKIAFKDPWMEDLKNERL